MKQKLLFHYRNSKILLKDTYKYLREAQLPLVASSLAYITILSIIPLLAVSFSIFQAFGGLEKLYETIEPLVIQNLAQNSSEEAMAAIRRFITNAHAAAIGTTGLVALIITSMSMLSSIENSINRVWKTPNSRTIFQRIAAYWLIVTMGPLALAIVFGFATSSDFPVSKLVPSGTGSFLIAVSLLFIVYKYVPNRHVNFWPALISATCTAFLWNLARFGYAIYTQKVVSYSKIYGSLGAIPILLLWIYIIWLIILSGVALSAALQKRTEVR